MAEYKNDWVGRAIAETQTCTAANVATLTYDGTDEWRAIRLHYEDVQGYLKRLRKNGFPVRFLCAGEYGSKKGRCHWHVILFWQSERVPEHPRDWNFQERHWPWGHSRWSSVDESTIRYVCKYITKDISADIISDSPHSEFHMSRRPPLGGEYFRQRALQHVQQGLPIKDRFYSFPWVKDRNGQPVKFALASATLDLYCAAYLEFWKELRGGHPPHSDVLEKYEDQQAYYTLDPQLKPWIPPIARPNLEVPFGYSTIKFEETLNNWTCEPKDENSKLPRLFWSFDESGMRAWESVIRTPTMAARSREALKNRKDPLAYRQARDSGAASEPPPARIEPKVPSTR